MFSILAGFELGFFFPHVKRGFFPGNLKGYRVPKLNILFFELATSHYYLFVITIIILSATQIGLLGGFTLGVIPVGYPKRPILGASAAKQSEPT